MMKTILILEDDTRLALHWQTALEEAGYAVTHETEADAAIDVLKEIRVDLIVTDILIRDSDNKISPKGGFTLITYARLRLTPSPKVIAVTGANPTLNLEKIAESLKSDVVLTKPVPVETLLKTARALLAED